jgi:hypothetical protein
MSKKRDMKKAQTSSRIAKRKVHEEEKSSLIDTHPHEDSGSDREEEAGPSDSDYTYTCSTKGSDLKEAAQTFAGDHPEVYAIISKCSRTFLRNYTEIKNVKAMKGEPVASIDKELIKEVFKLERGKIRLGMDLHDLPCFTHEDVRARLKRSLPPYDLLEKDTRPSTKQKLSK